MWIAELCVRFDRGDLATLGLVDIAHRDALLTNFRILRDLIG
jgi:hypothetical protein